MTLIDCHNLCVKAENGSEILSRVSFQINRGAFIAVLGENGAGKTTLLDTMMGFRKPSDGTLLIDGLNVVEDNYHQRQTVAYLSEKVDMPGDWTCGEFLEFNRFFYPRYETEVERSLMAQWQIRSEERIVNLSAGELRRVQIIAALCQNPTLLIIDEISAVLDIVGRRRFMSTLKNLYRRAAATILFATNILEDLESAVTHILILRQGRLLTFQPLEEFMGASPMPSLADRVAKRIERQ
jgi:ABC-2 type transport system ATP-binding protein